MHPVMAGVLAEQAAADEGDIEPWVVANAIVGVHGALAATFAPVLAGDPLDATLAERVREQAKRSLALLARGLEA